MLLPGNSNWQLIYPNTNRIEIGFYISNEQSYIISPKTTKNR